MTEPGAQKQVYTDVGHHASAANRQNLDSPTLPIPGQPVSHRLIQQHNHHLVFVLILLLLQEIFYNLWVIH